MGICLSVAMIQSPGHRETCDVGSIVMAQSGNVGSIGTKPTEPRSPTLGCQREPGAPKSEEQLC